MASLSPTVAAKRGARSGARGWLTPNADAGPARGWLGTTGAVARRGPAQPQLPEAGAAALRPKPLRGMQTPYGSTTSSEPELPTIIG